jgi:hypothetical protein
MAKKTSALIEAEATRKNHRHPTGVHLGATVETFAGSQKTSALAVDRNQHGNGGDDDNRFSVCLRLTRSNPFR